MKNPIFNKIASVIAVIIGILPVITGTKVLIGAYVPDYTVLIWLVIYNVSIGALSVITGILIWINNKLSKPLTVLITVAHISILTLLLTVFSDIVSTSSIKAMLVRSVTWVILFIIISKNTDYGASKTNA